MKVVDRISKRLIEELKEKGFNITNDNGASNAIIIAIAEAYGIGKENGEISGKVKLLEKIEESLADLKHKVESEFV